MSLPLPSIGACLKVATARLAAFSSTPRLDAELLLAGVLRQTRAYLYTWPERLLESTQWDCFDKLLVRREAGEPIAYLSGHREFWSLDLRVSAATLIPRPETELLVELALQGLQQQHEPVVDLGTGSGAVALAIARERPDLQIMATDIDADALAMARENARRLEVHNLDFFQGNWFGALPGGSRFSMVVSNPPYLASDDPHLCQGDLRFEPRRALVAGHNGLESLEAIIAGAVNHLLPGGWCLLEHGHTQADRVSWLLDKHGFQQISDYRDGEGRPRVAVGRLPLVG